MAKTDVYGDKFNTPVGRFSYPHLFEKAPAIDGKEGKYEVTLLIPKTVNTVDMKKRLEDVAKKAFGTKFKTLEALKNPPIRDGDTIADDKNAEGKDGESFRGNWVIKARSGRRPPVAGADKLPLEKEDIYGGCWGRMHVTPGSYNNAGNWGVTLYLDAVQKQKDGERFGGGGVDPDAVFDAFEEDASSGSSESDDSF